MSSVADSSGSSVAQGEGGGDFKKRKVSMNRAHLCMERIGEQQQKADLEVELSQIMQELRKKPDLVPSVKAIVMRKWTGPRNKLARGVRTLEW
eukprot:4330889-Lingulodinium_polyedra.AAC.1